MAKILLVDDAAVYENDGEKHIDTGRVYGYCRS